MTKILAFSGRKQSGKTTCSNFIHGYQLRAFRVVDNFAITEDGRLLITTDPSPDSYGELNVHRKDAQFVDWASYNRWPYIKSYSLATPLKLMAIELFGLKEEQVFGSEIQKNKKTHLKWEDMPKADSKLMKKILPPDARKGWEWKKGKMTGREFLQFFGTEICRKIHEDIWADRLIKDIEIDSSLLAIVDDVRFENEVEAIQAAGGKVVRLTRSLHSDDHSSETNLDSYDNFDETIDNKNLSINETNQEIVRLLEEWGWLGEEVKIKEVEESNSGIHKIRS